MNRNERFEALAIADPAPLMALGEQLLESLTPDEHTVQTGSLMLRLREPVADDLFNMGELLVTEASVLLAGARGYAMRLGLDIEATLAAALIDAAAEVSHPLRPQIDALLEGAVHAERARRRAKWNEVAGTSVVFDEM